MKIWKCDICGNTHCEDDVCYYDSNKIAITYVNHVGIVDNSEKYDDVCRDCLNVIREGIKQIKINIETMQTK